MRDSRRIGSRVFGHSTPRASDELRAVTDASSRHYALRVIDPAGGAACYAGAVRGYAAGGDIVKDVFVDQQKFALMTRRRTSRCPSAGHAAIRRAEKRKAIMAKVRARLPSLGVPRASRRPRITGPMLPRTGPFARVFLLSHHLGFLFGSRKRGCWRAIGGGTPRVALKTASASSRSVT